MKAKLIKNANGESRVALEFETDEEHRLFESEPDLRGLVVSRDGSTGALLAMTFQLVNSENKESY